MAHVAVPLHADARHETLRARDVRDEIVDAVGVAVAIAEAQVDGRDARQRALSRRRVGVGPRVEPRVHHAGGAGVDRVGDDVRKQRQLISPALDVIVAHRLVVHFVRQPQARGGAERLELDGDARAARRNHLAARVAVGEDDPFWRADLDDFADDLCAARIADFHPPAGPRVDFRSGAPPRGPARRVRQETKDGGRRRLNDDGAIERKGRSDGMRVLPAAPFRQKGSRSARLAKARVGLTAELLRRGFGPRRVCSSSAASFSRHSESSHIRSSIAPTEPNASRRAW